MDRANAFWLFFYKQLMVLRFRYKSIGFILVVCFGLQYLLLRFMYQPIQPLMEFYSPSSPETLLNGCFFDVDQTFFAPDTAEVISFMEEKCGSPLEMKGFSHTEAMVKTIEECKDSCVGVQFKFPIEGNKTTPSLEYIIYTNRMKLHPEHRYVTDSLDSSFSQSSEYSHFIKLQHSIDLDYISQITNMQPEITVQIGSMPYMRGGYFQNEAGITFGYLFPIFFLILLESTFFVPLVEEKQDGLKEFLVIATPLSYLNGISFYVVRLIVYTMYSISVLVVAGKYNALGIIPEFLVFILAVLFMLAMMSYTYLISVFFNTVFYAKTFGFPLLIAPLAFKFISNSVGRADVYLFTLNAFTEAWNTFQIVGNKYEKFEIFNLHKKITASSFSICQIYIILVAQTIVYSLLYIYLAHIFPGPGGIKKSYLFFLEKKFWKKAEFNEYITSSNCSDAIIIQNLQKQFNASGRKIVIADRLNMTIKNRQITVLLGHNGAGKTTTINMIMGLVTKDGGRISVCSERDVSCYRHLIGYCPQNSIYMQYMTCKEHLIFFAKLRGLGHQEAQTLANKLLKELNLKEKANEYGKSLSGGMKRRLSLGIAIAGDTKIVVLDEPSSGLDIQSRRELWDILLELRKTKAILITTHHMEEAEVLGDTINILSNGRLQLTGSPLELKRKVGSGYILKLCVNPSQYNEDECLELIKFHVPSASIMITIPFLLTTLAIIIIHSSTILNFGTGLKLSLDHYENGRIYVSTPSDATSGVVKFTNLLRQQIKMHPGIEVKHLTLNSTFNIEDELIEIMKGDFFNFQQNVIGTIHISGESFPIVSILYSTNMFHSPAILTNLVDNVIYMWNTNNNNEILKTTYAPVTIQNSSAGSLQLAYYATFVPMGVFMMIFYFAILPFKENRSGFKRLQATSSIVYWSSNLIFDLILLFLVCCCLFTYQTLIMPDELYNISDLYRIVSAIFFYGLTYLPLLYCLTNIVTTMSALSTCLVALYYASIIPTLILSTSVGDMIKYENYITFLRILPDFNLCHQLRVINERFINNRADHIPEEIRNELNNKNFLQLGTFYIYVFLLFPLLMCIFLFVVENNRRRHKISSAFKINLFKTKPSRDNSDNEQDRFIQEEKSTVEKIIKDNVETEYPLLVKDVYKKYNEKVTVNDLNFVVRKQECFGLLGVNGAGKTTTFEMIAANQVITSGTIKIDGVDIAQNESEYRYRFGYCPQNESLNEFMTAYQTLKYMALLRGIKYQHVHDEVMYWIEKLDLMDFKNVDVKHYSGGTKRKLQTAAAMIGSPSLVLLDEPTTGVDPISRRFLWKTIQDFQKRDKTIVLTSHSMDECEHLCNRLAIMAEGQFKCLGHVPELKQLYGAGFTISIKLRTNEATDIEVQTVTHHLKEIFPHCKLRESHAGILTYFIKSFDIIAWSDVFSRCAQFQNIAGDFVEEYSVNETTLEDIFLKYEKYHERQSNSNGQVNVSDSPV
ncbi:ATP-binding cassette sub-family A member 17 isoform X2 [Musca domestica]|uniref:ATP-binding cassette sub-family A member 17 isoform X3 n=1 Tax=Musca domestica TaxID=7370 RepID=A0A1I8MA33_MUSDO|nr:ATP-binding cassette sub-family A member 17 isoform X2 [Musca domestica]